ncbi:hypothetical protein GYMLUDRAFT_205669 [Collybiopsis luxurians FD-317 M1]|uniref:Beta-galactosidase n=1 Tax=Collybiopsis luxurians FD-317 M1 TaxID=944289 RepID=A0A0D0CK09_9AGAR|nr:hypothetical protein GYMLUDRAFT_205669 [Collybiopsis luxurians FD-317 M1]
MFKLEQALTFALALLAATGTCVGTAGTTLEAQKRTNGSDQCSSSASPALNFASSQWIWTTELTSPGGDAPVGSRAFRKAFLLPEGKTPASLTIAYAVDDIGTLWVNGNEIVTEGPSGWLTAGSYCVDLQDCGCGVLISFNVTNIGTDAGLLVDALLTYTDGTTSPIVSDGSWRTSIGGVPNGFQSLSFDDSTWELVETEGQNGVAPWGNVQRAGVDPQSLVRSQWIWTNEAGPGQPFPTGARAFRYTLELPAGQTSGTATVMIVVDAEYSLYINGGFIGSGTVFTVAQKYVVPNVQGPEIVFAVYAVNTGGTPNPAGLLASIQVVSQDDNSYCGECDSTSYVVSASGWKVFPGPVPSGFEQPGFDDSAWPEATEQGQNGVTPWPDIATPTTVTTGGTPLPGAPAGSP